jgi:hypothetical protein
MKGTQPRWRFGTTTHPDLKSLLAYLGTQTDPVAAEVRRVLTEVDAALASAEVPE